MNMKHYVKNNKASFVIALGFIAVLILVVIGFAVSNNQDSSHTSVSSSTSNDSQTPPSEPSNTPPVTVIDSVDQSQPSQSADNSETTVSTSNTPTNNVPVVNNNNEGTSTGSSSNQQVPSSSSTSTSNTNNDQTSSSSNNDNQQNTQQSSNSQNSDSSHNQINVNPNEQDRGSTAQEEVTCTPPKVLRNNQCQDPVAPPQTTTLPRITGFEVTRERDGDDVTATIKAIFSPANFADNYWPEVLTTVVPNEKECSAAVDDNGNFIDFEDNVGITYFVTSAILSERAEYRLSSYQFHEPGVAWKVTRWNPTARGGWFSRDAVEHFQNLEGSILCFSVLFREGADSQGDIIYKIDKPYVLKEKTLFTPQMKIERTEEINDVSTHTFYLADVRRHENLPVGPYIEALPVDSELVIIRASHAGVRAYPKKTITYPTFNGQTETIGSIPYGYADGREYDDITKSLSSGCPRDYANIYASDLPDDQSQAAIDNPADPYIPGYIAIFLKSDLPTSSSCRVTFTFDKADFTEDYTEEGVTYVTLAGIETVTFEYPTLTKSITVRR